MSHSQEQIVIIGNGMVGHHFCRELSQATQRFKLTIIGEESSVAYDRVHLSEHFYGSSFEDLQLSPPQWYTEKGIACHTEETITRIDTRAKSVSSNKGNTYFYDKLIFATGSHPFVPPIANLEHTQNTYTYRNFRDLEQIKAAAARSNRVAILGGGLLGLEAARACLELQLETFVIEMADYLMPRQLDKKGANKLEEKIEDMGIHLLCGRQSESVSERGAENIIHFKGGDQLAVDMIIISAGVTPRDECAKAAGIECNPRGGIIIDDNMQTSTPDVYAIGECAFHQGKHYGLVAPGYKMSSVLSHNLLQQTKTEVFKGMELSTRLKLMGLDVVSIGQPFQPGSYLTHETQDSYRRLTLMNGVIIGIVAIGPWEDIAEAQKYLDEEEVLDKRAQRHFRKSGSLSSSKKSHAHGVLSWPDNMVICNCMNVTKGQILKACQTGATQLSDIKSCTGAGSVCGTCQPQIAQFFGKDLDFEQHNNATQWIKWTSLWAGVIILLYVLIPGLSYSETVQSTRYTIEVLWRDSDYKMWTGYSCLALLSLSMVMSLRKRWDSFNWGNFQLWRVSHILLVSLIFVALLAHTGWRMGNNINFALMCSFLITSFTGLLTSWAIWNENKPDSWAKRHRKNILWLHIFSFWPLPALLGFHILKFYVY